jgi:hypothetical protein
MPFYRVGVIYTRCFIQKSIDFDASVRVFPIPSTRSSGIIHEARASLAYCNFPFSRADLETTLRQFAQTGPTVCVEFRSWEASTFDHAIDAALPVAEAAASAAAVVSANPAVPLCAYAQGLVDSGVKLFAPIDRHIQHGTNVHGFLDGLAPLKDGALASAKLALLLRLYRASLREPEIDNQLLFN